MYIIKRFNIQQILHCCKDSDSPIVARVTQKHAVFTVTLATDLAVGWILFSHIIGDKLGIGYVYFLIYVTTNTVAGEDYVKHLSIKRTSVHSLQKPENSMFAKGCYGILGL